jgi:hypothetical protein
LSPLRVSESRALPEPRGGDVSADSAYTLERGRSACQRRPVKSKNSIACDFQEGQFSTSPDSSAELTERVAVPKKEDPVDIIQTRPPACGRSGGFESGVGHNVGIRSNVRIPQTGLITQALHDCERMRRCVISSPMAFARNQSRALQQVLLTVQV